MNQAIRCQYASLAAFVEARRIRPIRQGPSLPGQMELPFNDGGGDNCGRQDGGRFATGNNCQEGAGSGEQQQAAPSGRDRTIERLLASSLDNVTLEGSNMPDGFENATQVDVRYPREVGEAMGRIGISSPQLAGMSPGANEKNAKVSITSYGDDRQDTLRVRSSVPIDDSDPTLGEATVQIDIERGKRENVYPAGDRNGVPFTDPIESALHLDLFQVSDSTKDLLARSHSASRRLQAGEELTDDERASIDRGAKVERMLGVKLLDLMSSAISAAEENGIHAVYTYAAGSGHGETNIGESPPTYRGYALWGRFGLDGKVRGGARFRDTLDVIATKPDHPDRDMLPPEAWETYQREGFVMLQDLLATKKGERLWKANGSGTDLFLNLRDKKSKGYQKFQKMKQMADRARRSGQSRDFFEWLLGVEHRTDPALFFRVERRGLRAREASLVAFYQSRDCGRVEGGKFGPRNDCQAPDKDGTQGGSPKKEKPLDANDPKAVKEFLEKMRREAGVSAGDRPKSLEQQRLEAAGTWGTAKTSGRNPAAPKSLEQQRLEAAGEWDESEGAEKDRKQQVKRLDTMDRHDSMDPLKDALRSAGVGWSQYASQANDHVRQTDGVTRKQFHKKAAQAALRGPESLAKFFDESGLPELAKKVRTKRENRNCGTGSGGFQKGNTCAGAAAAEAAAGAVKGALTGASIGASATFGYPKAVATGAAAGAAAGAVKGLYDNQMRPTRVTKAIEKIGSSDERVASMVKGLGGSRDSLASTKKGKDVHLDIKDSGGKKIFDVDLTAKTVVITPARASGKLSSSEISRVKQIAEENSPKEVSVVVKSQAPSYISQLAKAGFKFAATQAGIMIATAVLPAAPALVGTVIESTTGVELERLGKKRR